MSKRRIMLLSMVALVALVLVVLAATAPVAKKRAESLGCASAVTSMCLAAHLWAEDHGGSMPTNFISMSNEIATPKVLSCVPSRRTRSQDWSDFTAQNCTYEILAPGMQVNDTNTAFLRCTIHGHIGYSDGTVFDGVRRRGKFQ